MAAKKYALISIEKGADEPAKIWGTYPSYSDAAKMANAQSAAFAKMGIGDEYELYVAEIPTTAMTKVSIPSEVLVVVTYELKQKLVKSLDKKKIKRLLLNFKKGHWSVKQVRGAGEEDKDGYTIEYSTGKKKKKYKDAYAAWVIRFKTNTDPNETPAAFFERIKTEAQMKVANDI